MNGQVSWTKKWGRDKLCGITLTRLRPGKDKNGTPYVITLKCQHRFWRKALLYWFNMGNRTCPICRQSISL